MRSLAQLAFLKRAQTRPVVEPDDEGRVLALFRNRAELKKAYGELQDEVYRLKDRIKQQEGATARVQEMLGALESRLGIVETAYPALVFYQLRALWQRGREIVEQFVGELQGQQEERERRAHFAECNRRQFARRQTIEATLRAAETQFADAQQNLVALEQLRATLTRLWHYFKRREADRRLQAARLALGDAEQALNASRGAAAELEQEAAPQFPGLSVEARRAINLAAVAYSEVLCLRLVRTQLVALAREAASRREAADQYGDRAECEALIAQIDEARVIIQSKANVAQEVKVRTERLRQIARYRNPTDTSPVPESVGLCDGDVLSGEPLGATQAARMPNVLAEDTWDLFRILLR